MTISCYVPERKLLNTLKFTTIGFRCFLRVVLFFANSRWIFLPGYFFLCYSSSLCTPFLIYVYIRDTRHTHNPRKDLGTNNIRKTSSFFATEPRRVLSIVLQRGISIYCFFVQHYPPRNSNAHGSLTRCFLRRRRHNTD